MDAKILEAAAALGIKKPIIHRDVMVPTPKDLQVLGGGHKGLTMVRKAPKVHGNEPCTCGSGKKAKRCCYMPYR